MHAPLLVQPAGRCHRGFTLIELMMAMVIAAILLAIALPNFNNSQRKSRRSDAFGALTSWQQAEERWRSNNPAYSTSTSDLGTTSTSTLNYYSISASVDPNSSGTSFILTATANAGTSQANDSGCQVLVIKVDGGNVTYGSTSSGNVNWSNPDPQNCWVR